LSPASCRLVLQPFFRARSGHALQHLLMYEGRISRHLAQAGEAILFLFYLRILLPLERVPDPASQRCLLRLLARRSHLERSQLAEPAAGVGRLLQICIGSVPSVKPEPRFIIEADALVKPPLTVSELTLNGRQLHLAGWPTGPAMRSLLERLLSKVINHPEANRPADLLAMAWALGGRKGSQMKKDKIPSCQTDSDL
jgi:hypothetical protein